LFFFREGVYFNKTHIIPALLAVYF
jgi:hypothetical protein